MASKLAPKPAKGEAWIRRRDRFVVDIESVSRRKITVVERMMLLLYEYTPEQFARYFRPARVPIGKDELIEPELIGDRPRK